MPNWCMTKMTIRGTQEECERFKNGVLVEELEEPVYDFSARPIKEIGSRTTKILTIIKSFYPCPEELYEITSPVREEQEEIAQQMMKKYGATDWYYWQNNNWGTKWGDCHTVLEDETTLQNGTYQITYGFDTAWGTATKAFTKISTMFPTLRFDFFHSEEAGFFQGAEVIKNGVLVFEDFFAPCEYPEPQPDDDEALEKWDEAQSEWCEERQDLIDAKVDAIKI